MHVSSLETVLSKACAASELTGHRDCSKERKAMFVWEKDRRGRNCLVEELVKLFFFFFSLESNDKEITEERLILNMIVGLGRGLSW